MNMNFKLLCLVGIVLLLCLNTVSAGNVYVNTNGKDSNNGLSTTNSKQTIKNATLSAKDNDKIYISKGVYKENNIILNKTLTLIGDKKHGTIIDAQGKNGIIRIGENGKVTLKYITFKNGKTNYGGAIDSEGKLYITNCKFINNKAKYGSAISSYTQLIVKNSVFYKNKGSASIYNSAKTAKIYNSIFKKNTKSIKAHNILIRNSVFSGNINKGNGGAINANKAIISRSRFSNNKAKYGGAIFAKVLRIKNSRFTKNSATHGGAIIINAITPSAKNRIYKCTFTRNTAKKVGGAIYLKTVKDHQSFPLYRNITSIKKSKFKSNKATKRGANIATYRFFS